MLAGAAIFQCASDLHLIILTPECAFSAKGSILAQLQETAGEITQRSRNGKITATLAIAWWVASIGGIIYVLNNPPI
ncbi:MAG: hypothetical protein ACI89J_000317 [Hyphomicrobiaceae bacterium]